MKIASSQLQMASTHASQQQHSIEESMRFWVGSRGPDRASERSQPSPSNVVNISEAGKNAQSADAINESLDDAVDKDPKLNLIRNMLEFITGKKVRIFDRLELESTHEEVRQQEQGNVKPGTENPPEAGYGLEYEYHESYTETEQTSFSASGKVKTADGREISFNIELSMQRSYHEESNISLKLGDAARATDPLVLNFNGNAAQLTDQRFAFDLNADGSKEKINFVREGSGFLVFDRNRDGKINDGRELFGPSSGDGFAELSAFDSDQNGWIDENDQQFKELQIWSKNTDGTDHLQSLSKADVGAIALAHVSTPFSLKNNDNQLLGEVRSSGIFLQEAGDTGTIQQIDLTA